MNKGIYTLCHCSCPLISQDVLTSICLACKKIGRKRSLWVYYKKQQTPQVVESVAVSSEALQNLIGGVCNCLFVNSTLYLEKQPSSSLQSTVLELMVSLWADFFLQVLLTRSYFKHTSRPLFRVRQLRFLSPTTLFLHFFYSCYSDTNSVECKRKKRQIS